MYPWSLPQGWDWIALEKLCSHFYGGGTPNRSKSEYFNGDIVWVTPTDIDVNNPVQVVKSSRTTLTNNGLESSSAKLLPPGTVLFSSRATIGKIAIAGVSLCTNQGFANLVCSHNLNNHYLAWCLRTLTPEVIKLASSTTYLEISRGNLRKFKIPIPCPEDSIRSLDTQRRIVTRIETLIYEVKQSRNLVDEIRQDVEQLIFTALNQVINKLDEQYPDSLTIKELISIGKIKIEGGGTPARNNVKYWDGRIPWVSPKDMKRWYIYDSQEHIATDALKETSVKLIPQGAILIVVRGMILAHTLPVAITQSEVTINQDMKALISISNLLPDYLGYILRARSSFILQLVETAAHGTKRLKTDTIMDIVIPIPPESEQKRIIEYLNCIQNEVDEILKGLSQDVKLLDLLEQSILDQAFRGEL
jgi:type I restriction enzyme S subunit